MWTYPGDSKSLKYCVTPFYVIILVVFLLAYIYVKEQVKHKLYLNTEHIYE